MKEGWSGTSRGANIGVSRDGARALHPGDFWRSLSRHSLRDVSKPRRPSTQPLVNGSQSTACLQAPALSPHSKGDIRTAPPSRSRVKNDYSILGMLSSSILFPSPLWGGARGGVQPSKTPPCLRFAQTSLPTRGRERDTRASAVGAKWLDQVRPCTGAQSRSTRKQPAPVLTIGGQPRDPGRLDRAQRQFDLRQLALRHKREAGSTRRRSIAEIGGEEPLAYAQGGEKAQEDFVLGERPIDNDIVFRADGVERFRNHERAVKRGKARILLSRCGRRANNPALAAAVWNGTAGIREGGECQRDLADEA